MRNIKCLCIKELPTNRPRCFHLTGSLQTQADVVEALRPRTRCPALEFKHSSQLNGSEKQIQGFQ